MAENFYLLAVPGGNHPAVQGFYLGEVESQLELPQISLDRRDQDPQGDGRDQYAIGRQGPAEGHRVPAVDRGDGAGVPVRFQPGRQNAGPHTGQGGPETAQGPHSGNRQGVLGNHHNRTDEEDRRARVTDHLPAAVNVDRSKGA